MFQIDATLRNRIAPGKPPGLQENTRECFPDSREVLRKSPPTCVFAGHRRTIACPGEGGWPAATLRRGFLVHAHRVWHNMQAHAPWRGHEVGWRSGSAGALQAQGHKFKSCTDHHKQSEVTARWLPCLFGATARWSSAQAAGRQRFERGVHCRGMLAVPRQRRGSRPFADSGALPLAGNAP